MQMSKKAMILTLLVTVDIDNFIQEDCLGIVPKMAENIMKKKFFFVLLCQDSISFVVKTTVLQITDYSCY